MAEQKTFPSVVEYLKQREQKLADLIEWMSATNSNSIVVKLTRTALAEVRHALLIAELNEQKTKEN
jgi:hypothetical protein